MSINRICLQEVSCANYLNYWYCDISSIQWHNKLILVAEASGTATVIGETLRNVMNSKKNWAEKCDYGICLRGKIL
jgi:hypothetical protein